MRGTLLGAKDSERIDLGSAGSLMLVLISLTAPIRIHGVIFLMQC
jgi:hypothetical protein